MKITDKPRYDNLISIAAKLRQICDMIEKVGEVDAEYLDESEYKAYILKAEYLIWSLSDIIESKTSSYIKED